jgi:hypothetical protein
MNTRVQDLAVWRVTGACANGGPLLPTPRCFYRAFAKGESPSPPPSPGPLRLRRWHQESMVAVLPMIRVGPEAKALRDLRAARSPSSHRRQQLCGYVAKGQTGQDRPFSVVLFATQSTTVGSL